MTDPGVRSEASPLEELLPPGFVIPAYQGSSIANLPATLGQLLGIGNGWAAPPLEASMGFEFGEADNVLLLLVDGVGWNRLQRELQVLGTTIDDLLGTTPRLNATLTSVAPATTSVATTVLLGNGSGPAQTGMLGYTFLLPQFGVLANMLLFKPVGNEGAGAGDLERWGLVPEEFVRAPSLAQVLARGGAATNAFMPVHLVRTPLSRMQLRGALVDGYLNWTDLWSKLGAWLEEAGGERRLGYAYLSDFDALSHRDGPDAPSWSSMWSRLAAELEEFVAQASGRSRGRTLLLVTADHGHVSCPRSARRELQEYPELDAFTLLGPGGEARHANLYARGGAKDELLAYCLEELGDAFVVLDAAEALAAGLYGAVEHTHPEVEARLGDILLLARGSHHLWDREATGSMIGMHGSLEPDEALVPLLAFEL